MASKSVQVGIVMGSDSDWETMQRCTKQLDEFGIGWEVRVISAHRTPDAADEYAATACKRGVKVIIAAAGMSAALPGALAARTILPVIGVPLASGMPSGLDAMLSIVQMPPGVPVGCVSIGGAGATNAAILAAQIIATGSADLAGKLADFKKSQADAVARKDAALQQKLK